MAWDFTSDRPIYLQLMDNFKCKIVAGYYKPGDKVETVRILAAEAAVNPNTMQKALSELEREGLMISNRTSGRYVTDDIELINALKLSLADSIWNRFVGQMRDLGLEDAVIKDFVSNRLAGF